MKKILIVGSAHVDFVSHVDKLPQGNEEFNVIRQEQIISGTGFKAADVFQHFDFPYELYAPIGTGIYGETVMKQGIKLILVFLVVNITLMCHLYRH